MRIDAIGSAAMQPSAMGNGMGGQLDAVSKDLQNQIKELQKKMQDLASNQEMPMEAKMKKRQELQKQISELEIQLRQHQLEARKAETQKKQSKRNELDEMTSAGKQKKPGKGQDTGMSAGNMEALLSADASLKQADVQGSTARKMEGKANVLEVEIQLDGSRGQDTTAKEEQLAKTRETAEQAVSSQMQSLAKAGETLQEAAGRKDDGTPDQAEEAADSGSTPGKKESATDSGSTPGSLDGAAAGKTDGLAASAEDGDDAAEAAEDAQRQGASPGYGYHPVDVRL